MNVPAALAVQSIPFAWLVLAMRRDDSGPFAVLYVSSLGFLLSLIVRLGDRFVFNRVMSVVGDPD